QRLVVAGEVVRNAKPSVALARFLPSGGADPSFGSAGTAVGQASFSGSCAALQLDGRVVVGGTALATSTLGRFESDGGVDFTFGDGGWRAPPVHPYGLALQTDGRILIAGTSGF